MPSFKNEGEIKIFLDKQKLRKCVASISTLQNLLGPSGWNGRTLEGNLKPYEEKKDTDKEMT